MKITLRLNNNSILDEKDFSTNQEFDYIQEMEKEYLSTKDDVYNMILNNDLKNFNKKDNIVYDKNNNYITCKCELIDEKNNSIDFHQLLKLIIDENLNILRLTIIENNDDFDSEIIFLSNKKISSQFVNNYVFDFNINDYKFQFIINQVEKYDGKYLTFNIKKISFNKE